MHIKVKTDFNFLSRLRSKRLVLKRISLHNQLGFHSSIYKGRGLEFAEFKEYSPGDPIKFVDWKVYGRTERLYLKLFSEERRLNVAIALDLTGSMFFKPEKINCAWNISIGLAYLACLNRDRVILNLGNSALTFESVDSLINFSRGADIMESKDFFYNLKHFNFHRNPSILFLISDFFEEIEKLEKFLGIFSRKQFETVAIQTLVQDEINPKFEAWRVVADSESNQLKFVNKSTLKIYEKNLAKHIRELKNICQRMGIKFVRFTGESSLDDFFIKTLMMQRLIR